MRLLHIGDPEFLIILNIMPDGKDLATAATNATPLVSAVSPKLPEFWPHACDVWLAQCEAQFRVAKVTVSQTKFDLCIQKLNEATVLRFQDLLLHPPAVDPYDELKKRLLQGFSKSVYQKMSEFAALPLLGDRRPSELMDSILAALAGLQHKNDDCPHVRYAFLSRLPVTIRAALISSDNLSLRELASQADVLWSTVGQPAQPILTISEEPPTPATLTAAAVHRPTQPKKQFAAAATTSRPPQPSPAASEGWCRYHRRFGWDARQCTTQCSWPAGNAVAGGRRN